MPPFIFPLRIRTWNFNHFTIIDTSRNNPAMQGLNAFSDSTVNLQTLANIAGNMIPAQANSIRVNQLFLDENGNSGGTRPQIYTCRAKFLLVFDETGKAAGERGNRQAC